MFAIIRSSGRQFKICQDQYLDIDLINKVEGEEFDISDVIMLADKDVTLNPDVTVKCEVVQHFKAKKVVVFKNQQRSTFRRKNGHRQQYTRIKIKEIIKN